MRVRSTHVLLAAIHIALVTAFAGCSSGPLEFDNDTLSDALSVTDVQKTPIPDPAAPGRVVGLRVAATVINSGFFTIDVPFLMRWSLLRGGSVFASETLNMPAGLSPGDSRRATLTIRFESIESLAGLQDAVTFDVLQP